MDETPELHPAIRGLKTVCRCNNIKYRTIERAIRDGAKSIAAIAAKTTATTGHCGGTCTPDVQAMLNEHGCCSAPAVVQQASTPDASAWWVRKQ
jgi:NAD(P)H-nitrite reductase large subunit